MQKASERASAGTMGEIELDLQYPMPCADGVDSHADLHAEAVSEWQHVFERSLSQRPLPGDGRAHPHAAAPTNRPAGEAECEPEATADTRGEGGDRHIGIPARNSVGQR